MMRQLASDSLWTREDDQKMMEKNPAFKKKSALLDYDQQPVVRDLRAVGLDITDVWDLVNTSDSYPEAIPVLLKHINLPYIRAIKEGIVRSLIVKESRPIAFRPVLAAYHALADNDMDTYVYALVIGQAMTFEDIDEIITIIGGRVKHPSGHKVFIELLARWRKPEKAKMILEKAGPHLQRIIQDPEKVDWLREYAEKILKRIQKYASKT